MDLRRKLAILADAAKYDASCASSGSRRARRSDGIGSTVTIDEDAAAKNLHPIAMQTA